jgi:hypothetical protein
MADGFHVEATMTGNSARDLNRQLLSTLRRTRLRAEWTAAGVTHRFFDYVPRGDAAREQLPRTFGMTPATGRLDTLPLRDREQQPARRWAPALACRPGERVAGSRPDASFWADPQAQCGARIAGSARSLSTPRRSPDLSGMTPATIHEVSGRPALCAT